MSDEMKRAADEAAGAAKKAMNDMADAAAQAAEGASTVAQQAAAGAAATAAQAAEGAKRVAAEAAAGAKTTAETAAMGAAATAGAAQEAAGATGGKVRSAAVDLADEAERLGSTVARSARTAWESEQRKELQDNVVTGLQGIAATIEEQAKKLAENPQAKEFLQKAESTVDDLIDQVAANPKVQETTASVLKALSGAAASLQSWLNQTTSRLEQAHTPTVDVPPAPPAADEVQDIGIQKSDEDLR